MKTESTRLGFCIFLDTVFQGSVPTVTDGEGKIVVFETENEAQREIVDHAMIRLQQFLDGERDFEDAITVEEYVVPVTIHQDDSITDEAGNCFGPLLE
jgi:hypothetical protein